MPNEFWSGFYTSRAGSKKMIRDTSAYLQASEKAFAKEVIKADTSEERVSQIMNAKEEIFDIMGVMQHHDAVTGTAR
jgi:lysosomal alpha-mannosidase